MTRTPRPRASSCRQLALGSAAIVITIGVALTNPLPAAAAPTTPTTSSVTIAAQAAQAVQSLDRWETTGSVADYTAYLRTRSRALETTASELGVPAAGLKDAWGSVSVGKQHVVLSAMSQLGVPYRSRMSQEGRGFDCSGLVLYAYSEAGIELPRSSGDQIRAATEIDQSDAEPGDLVYYPGHISLYIGADLMVHSPQSGQDVEVRPLFDRSLRFGEAVPEAL
jgi:cell wall-associated NlpC family hydrolase